MKTFELIRGFEIEGKKYEKNQLEKNGIFTIDELPYDYVSDFMNRHAIVGKSNYFGAINNKGIQVIPCKWGNVEIPYNNYFIVQSYLTKKSTYIDLDGKRLNKDFFDEAHLITNGLGLVKDNELYNYVKVSDGNYLDEYGYEAALPFTEGLGAVLDYDTQRWGYIDTTNNYVIDPIYYQVRPFSYGLAAVMNEKEHWGYIDMKGNQVIPFIYDEAYSFSSEGAIVTLNLVSSIIDKDNVVTRILGEDILKDSTDIMVECDNKYPYQIGDEIYFLDYNEEKNYTEFEETRIFDRDNKYGLVDEEDYEITPPIFDYIGEFYDGYAKIKLDGKEGHIDKEGIILLTGTSIINEKLKGIEVYPHIKIENGKIKYVQSIHLYGLKIKGDNLLYCKWFDNPEERSQYLEKNSKYINTNNCVLTKQLHN